MPLTAMMSALMLSVTPSYATYCEPEMLTVYVQGGWTPEQIREVCPDFGQATRDRELLDPPTTDYLCLKHIGDYDLGTSVEVAISSELRFDDKVLKLVTTMNVSSDSGQESGTWESELFTAPEGWRITGIEGDTASTAKYSDETSEVDTPAVEGGLVESFQSYGYIYGDDDFGDCAASESAGVTVDLKPVMVELQRI